ncbi:MAG: alpha/beta fold hydrolase [Sphingomonadales bacterium]|nr:alpha/beta fold hydrolase [Sphingomonadales bacterium]MDE2569700.1 alpha/beta fold hydrolase [Sphingomonadales bacterium]
MATRRIEVNGLAFNVLDEGEGAPVLLVHGFPDDHTVWRKQVPALVAAGYRVIAPDMRGCGETQVPPRVRDYALPLLVADIAALLDALGIERIRLVGHDWGAVIAWQFAIEHPERVERYAALSVGHPAAYARGGLTQKFKGWYVLVFQLRGIAERLVRLGDWRALRAMIGDRAEGDRTVARLSRPGRLTAGINYYRANIGLVLPHRPRHAKVPVMGVFSDGDRFLTEKQMRISARFVDAPFRFERVEGAGHWLQLEMPDRLNALLIDFLGEGSRP